MEQAAKGTHDTVSQLIKSINLDAETPHVLDAPCGHGGLSKMLASLNYKVEALDIFPPDNLSNNINLLKYDLNEKLPYDDGELDLCVTVEGIEHLDRPADFFHELSRILKVGGHLVLSTPNPDSLGSRYRTFFKGYPKHFNPVSDTERTSGHIHPIDRLFIERLRIKNNLDIVEIKTNRLYCKKFPWTIMKGVLTKKLPDIYRDETVLYGDVIIYHFIKK